jgi:succinoglycan biosynthesis transport protein ExoP
MRDQGAGSGWRLKRSLRRGGAASVVARAWPLAVSALIAGGLVGGAWALFQRETLAALPLSTPLLWGGFAGAGALGGLAIGLVLAIARAPARLTATAADRLEGLAEASVLALAPLLTPRDLRQVAPDLRYPAGLLVSAPESSFSQAVRMAAARIVRWRSGETGLSVAVIAVAPREGASSMAMALARAAALAGKRVALVDADPRERTLSEAMALDQGRGLWTVLDEPLDAPGGAALIEGHMAADAYTGLLILPQGEGSSPTRELYGHPRLKALIDGLKARFDLVVLDCGPVGLVDGRLTAIQADAVVLVACWNATLVRHLALARRALERLGAVVPGVIVNGMADNAVRRWLQSAP